MSEKNNSSKGELTLSRNHSLIIQKSDLVSRGLKLFYEIQNIQSDIIPAIQPRILIADDDEAIRMVLREYFNSEGFKTYTASRPEEVLEFLATNLVDVVTTDNIHPGISGLELTKIIKEKYDTEVIIMTGYNEVCSHEEARTVGASDLLYKPVKLVDLLNRVKKVLKRRLPTSTASKEF